MLEGASWITEETKFPDDAIGCQTAIVETIFDKQAGDVLMLKGNQGRLFEGVLLLFVGLEKSRYQGCAVTTQTVSR